MTRYETDYYAWLHEQARLLEQGRFDALDVQQLVEELDLMAGSERGELVNRLIILLTHLLKLHLAVTHFPLDYQRAGPGWRQSCRVQRVRLARLRQRNPSLQRFLADDTQAAYDVALLEAAHGLGLEALPMPDVCPWTPTQVLDERFWPDALVD